MQTNKSIALSAILLLGVSSCSIQRAEIAADAKAKMIGMSKENVLACMGPPGDRMAEGETEVWSYMSTNGRTDTFGSSTAFAAGQSSAVVKPGYVSGAGTATATSFGTSSTRSRFCTVNVVMRGGVVNAVNYSGPTGGLVTKGEQCAFAVENCVR